MPKSKKKGCNDIAHNFYSGARLGSSRREQACKFSNSLPLAREHSTWLDWTWKHTVQYPRIASNRLSPSSRTGLPRRFDHHSLNDSCIILSSMACRFSHSLRSATAPLEVPTLILGLGNALDTGRLLIFILAFATCLWAAANAILRFSMSLCSGCVHLT